MRLATGIVRFLSLLALLMLVAGSGRAEESKKVHRLGILSPTPRASEAQYTIMIRELAKLGFVEGRNLHIDARSAGPDELSTVARELVSTGPDVILAVSTALAAVKSATDSIPIVGFGPDPVAFGLAKSFARPGGNVTGIAILGPELDGKRLELLHEAVPGEVGILLHPASPSVALSRAATTDSGRRLGIEPIVVEANGAEEYPAAFANMRRLGVRSVVITANAWFFRDRHRLIPLATQSGLAPICEWGEMAADGCLIGYGPRPAELYGRAAELVSQILRGAAAGNLPIEQPTKFDLVINLKVARSVGLTLPASLLARADEVIE